jgi:diamine N-acetyltransferase
MITLRPLRESDRAEIRSWPPYPPAFADLDYSLREGGWLDSFSSDTTAIYGAEDDSRLVGFSLLSRENGKLPEVRIALHPERVGQGLGKMVMLLTLAEGFSRPDIPAIQLIVRKNNLRAQRLYQSLKFRNTGECTKDVHGKSVEFYRMEISRKIFCEVNRS